MSSFKALLGASAVAFLATITPVAAEDNVTLSQQTWYGYPDNSPPSNQVAYDCLNRGYIATGTGTYDDPLTYATQIGSELHQVCEITYFPYLKKYMIMADQCATCDTSNWIDVWISDDQGGQDEIDCENNSRSGNGETLIRNPPDNLEVDTNALYTIGGGCMVRQNTFPSVDSSM